MADPHLIVLSLGTRAADSVTVDSVSGIDPYTVTLSTTVPSTTKKGDKLTTNGAGGARSFRIQAISGTDLTVYGYPFNPTGAPEVGAGATTQRAYASAGTWDAAAPANLTTQLDDEDNAGVVWKGEIWEMISETSSVTVGGSTSSASYYKWLTAAPGLSWIDQYDGAIDRLDFPVSGVGGRWHCNNQSTTLNFAEANGRLENLLISTFTGVPYCLLVGTGAVARNCIIKSNTSGSHTTAIVSLESGSKLINSMIVDATTSGHPALQMNNSSGTIYSYHNTIVRPSDLAAGGAGIKRLNAGVKHIENTAIFGFQSLFSGTAGTISGNYNATTNASGLPGANSLHSRVFADEFTGTTNATLDMRALASGTLDVAGNTVADANGVDIALRTRNSIPTIGAWEVITVGGGGGAIAHLLNMMRRG